MGDGIKKVEKNEDQTFILQRRAIRLIKDVSVNEINDYDEIILIGSGKGVTSVSKIKEFKWKRRKNDCYIKLNKIYKSIA